MFKKALLTAAAVSAMISYGSVAQAEQIGSFDVTGNAGFFSEYSFRGITQSDEGVALQGGLDVAHDSGLYAGAWGSNIDFNDEADLEIDMYAGYAGEVSGIGYDVGFIYYAYPNAGANTDYDFWEAQVTLSKDFGSFSSSFGVYYSGDYFNESGDSQYYVLSGEVPVADGLSVTGHVGHQVLDDEAAFGITEDSYTDFSFGFAYAAQGFDLSLEYAGTDLDEPNECADGCDPRVIAGISRTF